MPGLGRVETQRVVLCTPDDPLVLASGRTLAPVEVAYETYGELAADAGNAVFVAHALTGDAHAAGHHGDAARPGWWDTIIGPGAPLDTDRFHVVCANLLGGCRGTTGPASIDPSTGEPYGLDFPLFEVSDLVALHRRLMAHLGISRLIAVIGGSLGGMQALQWAIDAPQEVASVVLVGASSRLTAQNIAFSAVAREAITRDPGFGDGHWPAGTAGPHVGLAVARMMAHITYLSDAALTEKFGRRRRDDGPGTPRFGTDFEVESYLAHQGETFLSRFDARSYLYLTRTMDYFDPFADPTAARRVSDGRVRCLVISFDSDWRFDTAHSMRIVKHLESARAHVTFREVASPWGHDSFLLDVPEYHALVGAFVGRALEEQTRGSAS